MPKFGGVYQKANHHLPFFDHDGIMKVSAKHENKERVLCKTCILYCQNTSGDYICITSGAEVKNCTTMPSAEKR